MQTNCNRALQEGVQMCFMCLIIELGTLGGFFVPRLVPLGGGKLDAQALLEAS